MSGLFPVRRPHTAGSESIGGAVKISRGNITTLKAREASQRVGAELVYKDEEISPQLFGTVELPRPPERPPPAASLMDDSAALWAKLMEKHQSASNSETSLASEKHEYKELYLLLLSNRSTKRVNATMRDHGSQAPLPMYSFYGDGVEATATQTPIFTEYASRGTSRPLSALTNAYGMTSADVAAPSIAPVPVMDMGLRLADKSLDADYHSDEERRRAAQKKKAQQQQQQQQQRPATAAGTTTQRPTSAAPPSGGSACINVGGMPSAAIEAAAVGANSYVYTISGSRPTTAPSFASSGGRRGSSAAAVSGGKRNAAEVPVIPDAELRPVADKLNLDLHRIQEQLIRGEKLSAALHHSLLSLRRSYASATQEQPGQDRIASILKRHSAASSEKQRAKSRRAAVDVNTGRLKVGHTQLSAEKTAEIHGLTGINPGLATAAVAIIRNTQVQGGRVRRASVQFHDAADVQDGAASNAVERRQHEHFLERPHRVRTTTQQG